MLKKSAGLLVMLILVSMLFVPAMARAQNQPPTPPPVYTNEVLGVELVSTNGLTLIENALLSDTQYGFSLWKSGNSDSGTTMPGTMVLSVAMLYKAPAETEEAMAKLVSGFSDLVFPAPTEIMVDGVKGLMLTNVPGIEPNTFIYVVANGHLYQIMYRDGTLDTLGQALIDQIRFMEPTRTLESLGLKSVDNTLYQPSPYASGFLPKGSGIEQDSEAVEAVPETLSGPKAVSGCADWPTAQLMQTPIASTANGNGYSAAGPRYYGEVDHKNCNLALKLNDYYALDFPLRKGDVVYAPFTGTVKWIGWTCGGWDALGRVVIVEKYVGTTKYWSMAAHLNSINVAVGNNVTLSTVIGYAGGSATIDGVHYDDYWSSHLHQGVYVNASLDSNCGGIYAGQSVQPLHVKYDRPPGGYYETFTKYQQVSW